MLNLHEKEKVIIAFHRHWIVIANKMTLAAALLLAPLIILIVLPSLEINLELRLFVFYLISHKTCKPTPKNRSQPDPAMLANNPTPPNAQSIAAGVFAIISNKFIFSLQFKLN